MAALAQLNIARMKVAEDDPVFAPFLEMLDPVNQTAEASPGFRWRLVSGEDDCPELAAHEADGWLVNMSLWDSLESLQAFIRSPKHLSVMRRRKEWFSDVEVHLVLWWLPEGETPTFTDAMRRLEQLRAQGPSPEAFDFRHVYPAPAGA